MKLPILKHALLDNELLPFYVFSGDEVALRDIYVKKIIELSNMPVVRASSLNSIYASLVSASIFDEATLYIIHDDNEYKNAEKVWDSFVKGTVLNGNRVIMTYTKIDKRSAFAKAHEKCLVDFGLISDMILIPRVQAMARFSERSATKLVNMCGCNYSRILHELTKCRLYAEYEQINYESAFECLVNDGAIYEEIGNTIFEFANAVLTRNGKKALKLLKRLREANEADLKILSILYNNFRNALLVSITPIDQWETITGLKKWQCSELNEKINKYSILELSEIVKKLREIERNIKTGAVEYPDVIVYALLEVL